ncbi:hypothetical protein T09_698 [Trichinella sp. T9]|nr:hypothetical protein T09_698 [Trichinella sp. T9]
MYYAYLSFQIKLTTGKLSMEINFKCKMPKLMKGATPNELIKRCDGRSDVNHWMKSTRASETITQKHSDAYRSSWGVTITTRLALKQSLSTTISYVVYAAFFSSYQTCRIVRVGRICVYDLQSSKVGEEGKKKEDQADKTASKQFPCHAATTGTDGEVEQ